MFVSLLKKKKELYHMKLFLCSSGISLGQYCQKILTKSRGFGKKIKKRDGHIMGVGGVYSRGIKPSAHYTLKYFKIKLIMDITLNNSRPNLAQVVLFLEERIFSEN